jgi:hypothetical protein
VCVVHQTTTTTACFIIAAQSTALLETHTVDKRMHMCPRPRSDANETVIKGLTADEYAEEGGTLVLLRGILIWGDAQGRKHRSGGRHAVVDFARADKLREWFVHGQRHRGDDLPAVERRRHGHQEWWVDGVRHRSGGKPAIIVHHMAEWWVLGKPHRDLGLPTSIVADTFGTTNSEVHLLTRWSVHGLRTSESQSQRQAVQGQLLRLCVMLTDVTLPDDLTLVVLGPCLIRNLRVHWSIPHAVADDDTLYSHVPGRREDCWVTMQTLNGWTRLLLCASV